MKDLGDASFVLGIQIHRDLHLGTLGLSQKGYIEKVLIRFGMQDCKLADTPVAKGDKFSLTQCLKNDFENKEMKKIPYASAVGSLMYAQVCTRPDIAYIRTEDYMLTYRRSDQLEIIGYTDFDFVGCQDSLKSTSGYIFVIAGGTISWKSLRNFFTSLRIVNGIDRPLKLLCDNKSAVLYANNNKSLTKSKHIDVKFRAVKERVESKQLSFEHISTNSMIADPLTKGLPPKVFHEHIARMGVMPPKDL
uniref:Retrovirus-related Pol polyprotein from transposon TNT 1-94 n=1 Tax=Chenopodium quinoa TaxID=63459 RepID=A0A803L7X3_CHEQI